MNPTVGWALAVAALVAGWLAYRWPGLVMAVTVIAFWMLLQFNRALRTMKNAASAPVGHIDSAVMLNARLQRGLTLMQVVALTRSLGRKLTDSPGTWVWSDAGGAAVTLVFAKSRLENWRLSRAEPIGAAAPAPPPPP